MAARRVKKRVKKRATKRRVTKKRITRKRIAKKRVVKKRGGRKPLIKKPKAKAKAKENVIGVVTHYFPRVRAAVVKLKAPLSLGDSVRIKGHTTDFTQLVNSLQINCQPITTGKRGQEIGLLVDSRVRHNDIVYKP